jgi:hypothetical protein
MRVAIASLAGLDDAQRVDILYNSLASIKHYQNYAPPRQVLLCQPPSQHTGSALDALDSGQYGLANAWVQI